MGGRYSVISEPNDPLWFDPRTAVPGEKLWTVFWHHEDFDYDEPTKMWGVVKSSTNVESTTKQVGDSVNTTEVWLIEFEDDRINPRKWVIKSDPYEDSGYFSDQYSALLFRDEVAVDAFIGSAMAEVLKEKMEEQAELQKAIEHCMKLLNPPYPIRHDNE
jgi:hypothetical protein